MDKFEFHIDRKCTIWVREYHQFEAESYEQAESIMRESFIANKTDNTFILQDIQHETLEDMVIEENGGWPTAELYNIIGHKISDNT